MLTSDYLDDSSEHDLLGPCCVELQLDIILCVSRCGKM